MTAKPEDPGRAAARRRLLILGAGFFAIATAGPAPGQEALRQVHEAFDSDPGWEGLNNRVAAADGPIVSQDFGYRPSGESGDRGGEIGGAIWCSTTPASYGMRVGPFDYRDRLSASGRLRIRRATARGGLYLGFFNAERQGWRPWSALMAQFSGAHRGEASRGRSAAGAQAWLSALSATWQADSTVTDLLIPADGSEHDWEFLYDPDARVDPNWPHPGLARLFASSGRMSEESAHSRARESEPGLTRPELRRRLERAADQGLLVYDPRRGTDYWERADDVERFRGRVSLGIDGGPPRRMYLWPGHRDEPLVLDRFGVVNQQTYGTEMEFSLRDLTVNGHKIDLSQDPGWEGRGNRHSFRERDFHARQDFGFRETNWAGRAPGEVGGVFWRTEPEDPLHGFYADDVGTVTLDDPLAFSGQIAFVEGQPDSVMGFGYFNRDEAAGAGGPGARPAPQAMGILISGPTRVGYYFSGFCRARGGAGTRKDGPLFEPDRKRHRFSFAYDPAANGGVGRITVELDGATHRVNLTARQRAAGARFDRFGLWTHREGGKFVEVYLDDLTYLSRRAPRAVRHPATVVTVPYPKGGRKY